MMFAYLTRGSEGAGKRAVRERGTSCVQTEQQRIRREYLELGAHLHATAAEWSAIELHSAALQMRCSHPDLGRGSLPGHFNQVVAANQCPDCGYLADEGAELPACHSPSAVSSQCDI